MLGQSIWLGWAFFPGCSCLGHPLLLGVQISAYWWCSWEWEVGRASHLLPFKGTELEGGLKLPKGIRGCRWCLPLMVENSFSSFPQDAEISAFELRSILNRILAKRECLPPAGAWHGHQQVSSVALGAQRAPLTWAGSEPGLCPSPAAWFSIWPRLCSLCCSRGLQKCWGCASPEGVSQDVCVGRAQMGVFYPSSCHWELAARKMDLNNP